MILDTEQRIMSASTSFYEVFATTPQETVSRSIFEIGNRSWDSPRMRLLLEELLPKTGRIDDFAVEHAIPGTDRRSMVLNARQLHRGGIQTGMILLAIQPDDQALEATKTASELKALTAKLVSVQEANSKHLARELQEVFGQRLAAIGMQIAALEESSALASEARRKQSLQIAKEIGELATEIHEMSEELHPGALDDFGLDAALRNECLLFSRQSGIPLKFTAVDVPSTVPERVTLCLYRVAQESLREIGGRSGAREVTVAIAGGRDEIVLVVEDPGGGLEVEEAKAESALGLITMEARVRLLGGRFLVQSGPMQATRVEVRIPLR